MGHRWVGLTFTGVLVLGACTHDVETQWTPYRRYYQLSPKAADCRLHVAYDDRALPPHVAIATMSVEMSGGAFGTTSAEAIDAFRRQACQIGADGVVIGQDARQRSWWGGVGSATAFVWVQPAVPRPSAVAPTASVADTSTPQRLTPKQISSVVMAHYAEIRACYEAQLAERPIEGRVTIAWEVLSDGSVRDANLVESPEGDDLRNESIRSCIRDRITGLRFPASEASTHAGWTFSFRPGRADASAD